MYDLKTLTENFKKFLNETPDRVFFKLGGKIIDAHWTDDDAVGFGYLDNTFYMMDNDGENTANHRRIGTRATNNKKSILRKDFKFAGRFWYDKKIISFWDKYPTRPELEKIISDIKSNIDSPNTFINYIDDVRRGIQNLSIDSTNWMIDVPEFQVIDYAYDSELADKIGKGYRSDNSISSVSNTSALVYLKYYKGTKVNHGEIGRASCRERV